MSRDIVAGTVSQIGYMVRVVRFSFVGLSTRLPPPPSPQYQSSRGMESGRLRPRNERGSPVSERACDEYQEPDFLILVSLGFSQHHL